MTMTPAYYLRRLKSRYLLLRIGEILLCALGGALLIFGVTLLLATPSIVKILLSVSVGSAIAIYLFTKFRLHNVNVCRISSFLNRRYPELEESADLLIRDASELPPLQQLQQHRVAEKFNALYPLVRIPHRLGRASLLFAACAAATLIMSFVADDLVRGESIISVREDADGDYQIPPLPPTVESLAISVSPPRYTQLRGYTTSEPALEIPEGSDVAWKINFTDSVAAPGLVFSGGRSEMERISGKAYLFQKKFSEPDFYRITWQRGPETQSSDYYKIAIIRDAPPTISVIQLSQFTQLTVRDPLVIEVKCDLSDDYGLRESYIVATVSKGSGEAVKFREEKLLFGTSSAVRGKNAAVTRTVDLRKLGLEPGDELYFYVEAWDNKRPVANRSRTETFFVSLQDTTVQSLSVEGGLGVDLMPEYFRSQRQIIIDSEKLLREKRSIDRKEFNARSNELGYDQKVLRLKYGEFLGEEFSTSIGTGEDLPAGGEEHVEDGSDDADPTARYGHVHDKDNEHNLVPERKRENHNHNETGVDAETDPTEAYTHVHDDPEEATFFTQSIRAKLKAALTVMWDAELHLRLFDPATSLPYQYTALRLLKEISNDSRIYVHRTGFDPPPLKEEKRLTGDLTEIRTQRHEADESREIPFPAIRKALITIERKLAGPVTMPDLEEKQIISEAGQELAALALEQPGEYLHVLSQVNDLVQGTAPVAEIRLHLLSLRLAFWKALPGEAPLPGKTSRPGHPLDRLFIENLEALKND